jgi:hypothetical protein
MGQQTIEQDTGGGDALRLFDQKGMQRHAHHHAVVRALA